LTSLEIGETARAADEANVKQSVHRQVNVVGLATLFFCCVRTKLFDSVVTHLFFIKKVL